MTHADKQRVLDALTEHLSQVQATHGTLPAWLHDTAGAIRRGAFHAADCECPGCLTLAAVLSRAEGCYAGYGKSAALYALRDLLEEPRN